MEMFRSCSLKQDDILAYWGWKSSKHPYKCKHVSIGPLGGSWHCGQTNTKRGEKREEERIKQVELKWQACWLFIHPSSFWLCPRILCASDGRRITSGTRHHAIHKAPQVNDRRASSFPPAMTKLRKYERRIVQRGVSLNVPGWIMDRLYNDWKACFFFLVVVKEWS